MTIPRFPLAPVFLAILIMSTIAPLAHLADRPADSHFEAARARGLPADGALLLVSVRDQRLALIQGDATRRTYRISTSRVGTGSRRDSFRTPLGWHRVTDWIGGDARPGQVFVARRPTTEILPPDAWQAADGKDYVLTRILWLDGMEPGRNHGGERDSRSRYIYLHGTHQEHLLGRPASRGCIRLSNRDIMELFDLTQGRVTFCLIVDDPLRD